MPNIFEFLGYKIYFWSNEGYEPIHVHIAKGSPTINSTKVWLTKQGVCIIANNNSNIPQKDLNKLLKVISTQFFFICNEWKRHFDIETINFYC